MRTSTSALSPSTLTRSRLAALAFAAASVLTAVACGDSSSDDDDDGDDDGGGASTSGSAGTGGKTCDLKEEVYYSDCDAGCGDVMVCQSFCSDCEFRCMVPCVDSSDCEAVGAGSCEESTYGSNRCSGAPTKCPGTSSSTTGGGTTGSGGSCSAQGDGCEVNGDCCDFSSGNALCVDYGAGYGALCGGTCSSGSDCNSGCCASTQEGNYVCAPSEFCA